MTDRDKYRDNDDMRGYAEERDGSNPDTKNEARGDARETVGNNARGTDAHPTEGENIRTRPRPGEFDESVKVENRRDDEISES